MVLYDAASPDIFLQAGIIKLEAKSQFSITIHARDPHADILKHSLATGNFASPEVVRDSDLMFSMLQQIIDSTEAHWAGKRVHRKLSFRLHDGSITLSDELTEDDVFKVISIGSAISIDRFTPDQLSTKFRPGNGCQINIQMGDEASMLMVAVAYPAMGTFRIINKEVQLSLSAHSTAGASGPLRTKKDGIMAASAVMDTRHITKVTEEEAMRAIKGMTLWVRQEPAAESLSMRLTRQPRRPMSMYGPVQLTNT